MKNSNSGFTLIELIISISILSMLLYTGSFAYSTMANRWNTELGDFENSFTEIRAINMLDMLLKGTMPYVVLDKSNGPGRPTMFFVGAEDSLLMVSRNGLGRQDFPEIVRLTVMPDSNGQFDLVYQSASTRNVILLDTLQSVDFDQQFVLLKGMQNIQFSYFGHASFEAKNFYEDIEGPPSPQWFTSYSGVNKRLNPQIVRLTITKEGEQLLLNAELDKQSQRFVEHYISDREQE